MKKNRDDILVPLAYLYILATLLGASVAVQFAGYQQISDYLFYALLAILIVTWFALPAIFYKEVRE